MMFKPLAVCFFVLFVVPQWVFAQETGIPYATYLPPKTYQANPQNWVALQLSNGVMVFGNGDGILAFDGSRWHMLPMANRNLVRSLAIADKETLYAGGYNEIGFVTFDPGGTPQYQSLVPKIGSELRDFGHVWNITVFQQQIYFSTDHGLLKYDRVTDLFSKVELEIEASRAYLSHHGGQLLFQSPSQSLFVIDNDKASIVAGGDFYQNKRITALLPFDNVTKLICTLEHGLFLYDGKKSTPFVSEANAFLQANRLYKAVKLRNGNFAFATLLRGVVIINPFGEVVYHLEKGKGLGDNAVYNLMEDHQGALWVMMSVGISRVELQTPMTWFDERNGITGAINDIIRYNNTIYSGTMLGFYKLIPGESAEKSAQFQKIPEISTSVWAMIERHGSLLLATDEGTIELKNNRYHLLDEYSGAVMCSSTYDPTVVFVGLTDGVVILKYENEKWKSWGAIPGVTADVGEMNEDYNGNLWIGTFSEGVLQLKFPTNKTGRDYMHPMVNHYGPADGLPVGYVQLTTIGNELLFRVEPYRSLYRFNKTSDTFEKYAFEGKYSWYDSATIYPFSSEHNSKTWFVKINPDNNSYDFILSTPTKHGNINFSRVREDVDEVLFVDDDGIAWLGGLDGIVRFDFNKSVNRHEKFATILNNIKIKDDSILYRGFGQPVQTNAFSYDFNTISFSLGATTFDLYEENEYQFMLEGYDDDWSSWTTDATKSYTKIPEGNYTFKARTKNIYGEVTPEIEYSFTIKPPWYRHTIAYVIYGLLISTAVYSLVDWRSRKLEKEKAVLENIVSERTAEVSRKNLQLEQQAEELKTQTDQLKEMDTIKSNFFTNISHEFRTPLSLILAPLEKKLADEKVNSETEMMYRNAKRLQTLINQLLDLSKLEAGKMRLFLSRNDVTAFVRKVVSSFASLAQSKSIIFHVSIPDESKNVYFDADKLETILNNLLSNAFKFTPEGGEVWFSMDTAQDNFFQFVISDTGSGIPEKDLPKIFNRFYQSDGSVTREYEGSGIGLALTKELIHLMQGEVQVESKPGTGAIFTVTLPLSADGQSTMPDEISLEPEQFLPTGNHQPLRTVEKENRENYSILLVEDNRDLSAYLHGILEKSYNVRVAYDGEEALAAVDEDMPDLILSDMMMPRMDGFTLCETIRSQEATSHIPFILLTARSSVESRLAGLELGADDYMTKPFHVAELEARIRNLLRQRDNLRKRFQREFKVEPGEVTVTSTDEKFLAKVMSSIASNVSNAGFSVEQLSEEVGMSRKNLHRKLVALVDQSPNELIRTYRLKTAMQLLEQQSGNVKEVAFNVGFNNLSYFAKCFKEQFGISPTEVKIKQSES